jgi:methionyl-tRNA formyltransferase
MNIVFWGTPEFAAIILDILIKNNYLPVAVVTAPDKPVGRKKILTPPPVKVLAQKHNLFILQPEKLKENFNFKSEILNLKPDLFIVAAYGLILPKEILDIPKYGSLNIHPSLLPKYRGASPIQATILNGDKITGVTIILMDEKMDHGPILARRKLEIQNSKITYPELTEKLAKLGAELLIETLPKWIKGGIKPISQDDSKATYTKIIKKEDGKINWQKSAEEIERMIRAYSPWPGTYTYLKFQIPNTKSQIISNFQKPKMLKIIKAEVLKINHQKEPGTVFLTENKKLAVTCGQDALILEDIQLEGKRKMTAQEFKNGHPEIIGAQLT